MSVEHRVMPGPMFSGKWQVETRSVVWSPRYESRQPSPWRATGALYDTREAAEAAIAAPASALFRKEGHPYAWDVALKPASGKRWRYRGPHGWRSEIAATPAEAWGLLVARMKAGGWTLAEDARA